MEEYRQKQKRIGKITAKILVTGICFIAVVLLIRAMAEARELEYRAAIVIPIWGVLTLIAVALIGCVLWFLCVLFDCPLKERMHRIALRVVCAILVVAVIVGTLCEGLLTYFIFMFSVNYEKTVVINDTNYVARVETTGLENTGISYHKIVGLIFCEKSGWEVEFDGELWRSL